MDMVQLYFGIKCFAAVFVLLFPLISYLVEKIKDMKNNNYSVFGAFKDAVFIAQATRLFSLAQIYIHSARV